MPSTTFVDLNTPVIGATWLNEVDATTHNSDGTAVRTTVSDSWYYGPTNAPYSAVHEQAGIVHKIILDLRTSNASLSISDASGTGTGGLYADWYNLSGALRWGLETSVGGTLATGTTAYSAFFGTKGGQPVHVMVNNTVELSVSTDGIPYGRRIHNNGGAITGTTNQYICSGTYLPVKVSSANVSANTFFDAQWIRVGNVVTVSGLVNITATVATTTTTMDWNPPIFSNFAGNHQATGTAVSTSPVASPPLSAMILSDPAANDVFITYLADAVVTARLFAYTYTYVII